MQSTLWFMVLLMVAMGVRGADRNQLVPSNAGSSQRMRRVEHSTINTELSCAACGLAIDREHPRYENDMRYSCQEECFINCDHGRENYPLHLDCIVRSDGYDCPICHAGLNVQCLPGFVFLRMDMYPGLLPYMQALDSTDDENVGTYVPGAEDDFVDEVVDVPNQLEGTSVPLMEDEPSGDTFDSFDATQLEDVPRRNTPVSRYWSLYNNETYGNEKEDNSDAETCAVCMQPLNTEWPSLTDRHKGLSLALLPCGHGEVLHP